MSRSSVLRAGWWAGWGIGGFGVAASAGRLSGWLGGLLGGLVGGLLGGYGTPLATVPVSAGRPVVLLGHDPVASFSPDQPLRGDPALQVDLPARSDYFASAEHQAWFEADSARYEPQ